MQRCNIFSSKSSTIERKKIQLLVQNEQTCTFDPQHLFIYLIFYFNNKSTQRVVASHKNLAHFNANDVNCIAACVHCTYWWENCMKYSTNEKKHLKNAIKIDLIPINSGNCRRAPNLLNKLQLSIFAFGTYFSSFFVGWFNSTFFSFTLFSSQERFLWIEERKFRSYSLLIDFNSFEQSSQFS